MGAGDSRKVANSARQNARGVEDEPARSVDRLDLRLVEYFVAVAEELHFGRAAERLHIAQPSLSQQIRRLEEMVGVALLERSSRSVRLTEAGEELLREGRALLSQARRATRRARAAGAPNLTVGFFGSAASELLPEVLREFAERKPSFAVSVRELRFGELDAVADGQVDVAFTRLTPGQLDLDLEVEVISEEPRLVAVAARHPLAARRSLSFADLAAESFIINPMSDCAERWLAEQHRHGLPGRVAARTSAVLEILTLVAAGVGVCLVPATVVKHYPRDDVVYVSVEDAEPAVVSLAWRRGSLNPPVTAFLDEVRAVASGQRRSGRAAALAASR
jgi:DNA-binding transcriptional LysR family regulator